MTYKTVITLCLAPALLALGACSNISADSDATSQIRSDAVEKYARVDRMGQPAVATALFTGSVGSFRAGVPMNGANNERDAFNQGNPSGDGAFAGAAVNTIEFVHTALADDLDGLGVPRCSTGTAAGMDIDVSACVAQAAPAVLPDVITLNLGAPSSWPNGRTPDDPVVDRVLAAVLLDLSNPNLSINTLAGLPLNPPGNDARANDPSPGNFPYLRAPQ